MIWELTTYFSTVTDDGILDPHRQRRSGRQRRVIAISGHDRGCAGAGADRSTDRRALGATENATDDRASDRSAADLRGALAAGRIAFAIDRLGVQRQSRSVRQDDGREPDAESGALAHLAAALDQRHFAEAPSRPPESRRGRPP